MKVQVIFNVRAGKARKEDFAPILHAKFGSALAGIEHAFHPLHATEIARRAAAAGIDTVVAAGGDGTVNAVLNGIIGTNAALGILPLGTANDLASFLCIPADVPTACDLVLNGRVRHADLIRVNGRFYATGGGLGLPCAIAALANTVKRRQTSRRSLQTIVGGRLYLLAAVYALLREPRACDSLVLRWQGGSLRSAPLALMIDNQPFIGSHFIASPGAANDDGMFDVCLVENSSRAAALITLLKALKGRHVGSVKTWRATDLLIEAERPVAFFGDGEILARAKELKVSICPGALKVIAPERTAKH